MEGRGLANRALQKPEKIDLAWLRKLALNFEKRISTNTELRTKFEDKPEKYVQEIYSNWWVWSDLISGLWAQKQI